MHFILLAVCFLFICHPVHHKHRHHRAAPPAAVKMDCQPIALAFATKNVSRDDFVKSFPADQQHDVLVCIGDQS